MNNLRKIRSIKKVTVKELSNLFNINRTTITQLGNIEASIKNHYIQIFTNFFDVLIYYVFVKFQKHAENNQIVVAGLNGDEATVKRYKKIGSDTFLFADNENYEPIKLSEELDPYIVGVVKGLFRTEFK